MDAGGKEESVDGYESGITVERGGSVKMKDIA